MMAVTMSERIAEQSGKMRSEVVAKNAKGSKPVKKPTGDTTLNVAKYRQLFALQKDEVRDRLSRLQSPPSEAAQPPFSPLEIAISALRPRPAAARPRRRRSHPPLFSPRTRASASRPRQGLVVRTTCSMRKEANALKDANVSFGDMYLFEKHLCFDWKVFGFHKQQVVPLQEVRPPPPPPPPPEAKLPECSGGREVW